MKWNLHKDKVAPRDTPVLVFYRSGFYRDPCKTVAVFLGGKEWVTLNGAEKFDNEPTHWAELPKDPDDRL